jgi:CDP-glucose 4,6-dehydratase
LEELGELIVEDIKLASIEEYYKGKKVLVTGHTGFKGAWLSFWLRKLGA